MAQHGTTQSTQRVGEGLHNTAKHDGIVWLTSLLHASTCTAHVCLFELQYTPALEMSTAAVATATHLNEMLIESVVVPQPKMKKESTLLLMVAEEGSSAATYPQAARMCVCQGRCGQQQQQSKVSLSLSRLHLCCFGGFHA